MTTAERAELRKLAEAATAGPWARDQHDSPTSQVIARGNEVVLWHRGHGRQIDSNVVPNMEFIAAAREAVPNLLDDLDAALKALEQAVNVARMEVWISRDPDDEGRELFSCESRFLPTDTMEGAELSAYLRSRDKAAAKGEEVG